MPVIFAQIARWFFTLAPGYFFNDIAEWFAGLFKVDKNNEGKYPTWFLLSLLIGAAVLIWFVMKKIFKVKF